MRNKAGKIKLPMNFIDMYSDELIKEVFKRLVTFEVEHRHYTYQYVYIAYCDEFRELSEGERVPEYEVIISRDDDEYEVAFKEINSNGYEEDVMYKAKEMELLEDIREAVKNGDTLSNEEMREILEKGVVEDD